MQTQTIFKAGNSLVVAIPKHIAHNLDLTVGKTVTVDTTAEGDVVLVKPVSKKLTPSKSQKARDREFQEWLDGMLKEDKELLDELAHR